MKDNNSAMKQPSLTRCMIVVIILLMTGYITFFSVNRLQDVPLRKPLSSLPGTIGNWRESNQVFLDDKIVGMLGVDEYIERLYVSPTQMYVDLYVSYFNMLKENKQFHSPKNCLIGSGSTLLKTDVVSIPLTKNKGEVKVSYMLLQKGDRKQLILYWFQGRGRVMHSEYEERIYRVLDAVFRNRTDGSFIRISGEDNGDHMDETLRGLKDFASQIIPVLDQHFPGT